MVFSSPFVWFSPEDREMDTHPLPHQVLTHNHTRACTRLQVPLSRSGPPVCCSSLPSHLSAERGSGLCS